MSTDPTKSDFNPLLSLYSEDYEKPSEGVKVYDNIATFESSIKNQKHDIPNEPGTSRKSEKSFSKKKRVIQEAKNRDLGKLKELMERRKKLDELEQESTSSKQIPSRTKRIPRHGRPKENILTSMEKLNKGPYSLVYKIAKAKRRCNVYTRDFCGLRGVCSGYIVAFDRFLNLALMDVDETFRKPPVGEVADHQKPLSVSELNSAIESWKTGRASSAISGPSNAKSITHPSNVDDAPRNLPIKIVGPRLFKHEVFKGGMPQLYRRHVNQLLVRGDSVVLVADSQ